MRVLVGHAPSEGSGEDPPSILPASDGSWRSFARGSIIPVTASVFTWSCLCILSSSRKPIRHWI